MSKLWKKTLRSIVAAGLAASLIVGVAGCGKSTETKDPAKSTSNSSTTDTGTKLNPVELTWYYAIGQIQPDNDKVFTEVNKLMKEKINATIKFQPILNADYDEKMRLIVAANEPYDMCFTASWRNNYLQNVSKGAFLALDELMTKYAPKTYSQIPKPVWEATKVQGKTYAVVNYQITARQKGFWLMKDLVDKYKFDINTVKEIKDIEPFLKLVKENEPGVYPLEVRTATKGILINFSETLGYDVVSYPGAVKLSDKEANVVNIFHEPYILPHLKLIRDWYNKGYIRNDVISVKDTEPDKKAKKYAAGVASNIKPGAEADNKAAYGWDAVFVPLGQPITNTNTSIAALTAISKNSKNPERAMMALEIVNTDPVVYNLIANGIEGVHYTKDAGKTNRITPIAVDKYKSGFEWIFGNQFNAYLIPGKIDTVWEDTKKLNEKAAPSPLVGYVFDNTPVVTEVASYSQLIDELWLPLDCGVIDPEVGLQKFYEKESKINAQKIIDEVKKSIDTWKKTK